MKKLHGKMVGLALMGLLLAPLPALADTTVSVTVPEFPVTLNGIAMEQANSQYPSILYNNITYVPMTYHDAQLLGLEPNWDTKTGFRVEKADFVAEQATAQAKYKPYTTDQKNGNAYQATRPAFAVTVNGKKIDNSKEEYPLLVFRDVTYFPLTWRFAVDEFGWDYTFDFEKGLVITPVPTPVELDSSFQSGGINGDTLSGQNSGSGTTAEKNVWVFGDAVNLRSGIGTDTDIVGQASKGDLLPWLGESKDADGKLWYQVKTKTGATAWIAGWFAEIRESATTAVSGGSTISTGSSTSDTTAASGNTTSGNTGTATISPTPGSVLTDLPAANVGKVIYVNGDGVNIRSGAGTSYKSLGQVSRGESFSVLAVKNDSAGKAWYQIFIGDGETAWIASWLTSTAKPSTGSTSSSTGVLTTISNIAVSQMDRKSMFTIRNGEGNTYKMESVADTQVQYLLDNVQVNGQLAKNWDDFTMILTDMGNHQVRMNISYPANCYVNLEQNGDNLEISCFHTLSGLAGRVVVLDPGHGGLDVGAQGYSDKSITDADIGYTVCLKLQAMLEQAGAKVYLTRGDIPKDTKVLLADRMVLSNGIAPDIFVSVHANSTANGTTTVSGAQVYTYNNPLYPQKPLTDKLADLVNTGLKNSTQRTSVIKSDSLYVLRMNNHPSILVETGFLNNLEDEKLLGTDAYRQLLAEGIYQGVEAYFNSI